MYRVTASPAWGRSIVQSTVQSTSIDRLIWRARLSTVGSMDSVRMSPSVIHGCDPGSRTSSTVRTNGTIRHGISDSLKATSHRMVVGQQLEVDGRYGWALPLPTNWAATTPFFISDDACWTDRNLRVDRGSLKIRRVRIRAFVWRTAL